MIGLVVQERVGGLEDATLAGAHLPRRRGLVNSVPRRGGARRGNLPTYPTYGKLKKSLAGRRWGTIPTKVMAGGTLLQPQSFL